MDLIDRQETLKAMDTWDKFGCDENCRLIPLRGIDENSYVPYVHYDDMVKAVKGMPSAQKTAKRIVGCDRNGMTMWYQCDMCNEPVDEHDAFCRGCGRRFVHE